MDDSAATRIRVSRGCAAAGVLLLALGVPRYETQPKDFSELIALGREGT